MLLNHANFIQRLFIEPRQGGTGKYSADLKHKNRVSLCLLSSVVQQPQTYL